MARKAKDEKIKSDSENIRKLKNPVPGLPLFIVRQE